ncbi:SprT family zinc-dependent metalloprotease [Acidovorax lacteus]|uniref:M48 family metallopeptidase n=1 Tax=Acidovorax lacteus TaxID=1924988 RepID=UPI0031E7D9FB
MQRLVQLVLDLFDAPPAVAQPPASPSPPAPRSSQTSGPNRPLVLENQAQAAPDFIANAAPAVPLPAVLAPAEFRHPQANREIRLGDATVAFALQRARRRSIGFTVGADGLSVRAPRWVTLAGVDAAVREKQDWILRKLTDAQARRARQEDGRIRWADGGTLPYLGAPLALRLDPAHRFAGRGAALAPDAATGQPALHLALPHHATEAQIRDLVHAWLMREARRHFTERLDHFAPLLGVRWTALRLSGAQTRWGSAKADGSIRLNWRLMHYGPALIDYVVAHELAHLRVMDHSPRFWDTVAEVVPDYARLRAALRDQPAPLWE